MDELWRQWRGEADARFPFVPLDELPVRGHVTCCGYVSSVTMEATRVPPRFTAILTETDSPLGEAGRLPARLRLVWFGQRQVPGIGVGAALCLRGMVGCHDGVPTLFNPWYEILSTAA